MNIKEYTGWTKSVILKKGVWMGSGKREKEDIFLGGGGDTRIYFLGIL